MIYTVTLNPAVDRELTINEFAFDTVLRASEARVDCGGKGFNVSRLLASLGAKSVALGFAGGKAGQLLAEMLVELDIETAFTWIEGETRSNVSIVTEQHDRYLKVNESGPTISEMDQRELLAQIEQLVQPGDWWVLAGSLPPGVPNNIYAKMVALIQSGGGQVILDTSGAALIEGCGERPFLIKPNDTEASSLSGLPIEKPEDAVAAVRQIQALGPQNVVISLGKAGAIYSDGQLAWLAESPLIEERNPIGAGDSMVGGLVYGLSRGLPVPEALQWGIACGAATASLPGTAVGSRELVQTLLAQVKIKQFS
ncbi:MAG: 1-phosphofructokinase [Anaerolineales bacterium]|nr:1-phosphofructokinase [Anaerolineales bacterium]MCB8937925.1 1-phosphofructokinase [Ardenticatenaceae bacterium]